MKTYDVLLTKSYIVRIKAKNRHSAGEFSQVFTSDIKDLSTEQYRGNYKFSIEDIDCKQNDVFEIQEINEDN